ncbi:circadian clock protein KaiB [Ectothiorhodospira haloalkaliphila]|uniref:Circadian clock protein KaiB n=1 Tax=Ectothiorhodospira haloalkaliphila TaxID=421628 RepID=W8KGU7_9GAMM|nr:MULTISPECIES: circadian clock KaiB family protein [Ectothiorhodospira]AHK79019.1 circadian clock protein KaiB [Ectothiorhodospira haloalkaliphila]MCG5494794.1 circadian clock protein KaiB [Ectothiorhodospira variabilis]MCG5497583.1 circadian clock protein KaiB [Ectothiorhodospira variabilis]MCG5504317.1 circadian clock protein KaiB [Ectothiorhodospira variabilis]MCG5507472.1 circadian clock protein KaiB [Ectothiorhodospira variabilis]
MTQYLLRLYIAGMTPAARRAIKNLEALTADMAGQEMDMQVEVVDILERPQLAEDERILATPVVVRRLPPPVRRVVGDLSERERVLVGLDILER